MIVLLFLLCTGCFLLGPVESLPKILQDNTLAFKDVSIERLSVRSMESQDTGSRTFILQTVGLYEAEAQWVATVTLLPKVNVGYTFCRFSTAGGLKMVEPSEIVHESSLIVCPFPSDGLLGSSLEISLDGGETWSAAKAPKAGYFVDPATLTVNITNHDGTDLNLQSCIYYEVNAQGTETVTSEAIVSGDGVTGYCNVRNWWNRYLHVYSELAISTKFLRTPLRIVEPYSCSDSNGRHIPYLQNHMSYGRCQNGKMQQVACQDEYTVVMPQYQLRDFEDVPYANFLLYDKQSTVLTPDWVFLDGNHGNNMVAGRVQFALPSSTQQVVITGQIATSNGNSFVIVSNGTFPIMAEMGISSATGLDEVVGPFYHVVATWQSPPAVYDFSLTADTTGMDSVAVLFVTGACCSAYNTPTAQDNSFFNVTMFKFQ